MKRAGRLLAVLLLLAGLFPLAGWIGGMVPRGDAPPPVTDGVQIMVETNGVHTGIVMPVVTPEIDWRSVFPSAGDSVYGQPATHIAVGWGEREVFMNVPTWNDLKLSTALRAAFGGGGTVMRVSPYLRPAPGPNYRPVRISHEGYARMVAAIIASLPPAHGERPVLRGTNPADAYYVARGHYTLAYTCNNWVGDTLATGGIQMGTWTPFAGGVMRWIEAPEQS